MLIEGAEARQLSALLMNDAFLGEASCDVVEDSDRLARLLAAWAQVIAAGSNVPAALFQSLDDHQQQWVRLGADLVEAASRGEGDALRAAALRCAVELRPSGRASLVAHIATGVSPLVRLAGGLDRLLDVAALHRRCTPEGEEAGWSAAAAWLTSTFTAHIRAQRDDISGLVNDRIEALIDAGHAAFLWRTWSRVAASAMSPKFLAKLEPFPHADPDCPDRLWRRAVQAIHSRDERRAEQALTEFVQLRPDYQTRLAFEAVASIAACLSLPSRQSGSRAGGHAPNADDLAPRDIASEMLDELPAAAVERAGRMYALAQRAVLAVIDHDPATLAAVIDRVATFDDDPGRPRLPADLPRFRYVSQQARELTNTFLDIAERHGVHLTDHAIADAADDLVDSCAPDQYKRPAHALIAQLRKPDGNPADFEAAAADTAEGLVAFAATAAAVAGQAFPSRENVRLTLIKHIRESEAKALRIPDREIVTVKDSEAVGFLHQLLGPDIPFPRDPDERALWELDIIAVLQQHLLELPADATTEEQRDALRARILHILRAAQGTPQRTRPPGPSQFPRKQPKRTSRRQRRR